MIFRKTESEMKELLRMEEHHQNEYYQTRQRMKRDIDVMQLRQEEIKQ